MRDRHESSSGDAVPDGVAAAEEVDLEAELEMPPWWAHAQAHLATGMAAMAGRLPGLVRLALSVAWRASRVDTVVAITVNVAVGAATAFGLLATRDVAPGHGWPHVDSHQAMRRLLR